MRRHGGRFRLKLASDEPTPPEYGSGYRVDKSMRCRLRLPAVASWEAHVAPAWDEQQKRHTINGLNADAYAQHWQA